MRRRSLHLKKATTLSALFLCLSQICISQTVTNLGAISQHGQVFIRWKNIGAVDSGFYYVYKSPVEISDSNVLKTAQYLGRVPYNFGTDTRLTTVLNDNTTHYLVTDDLTPLASDENLFVQNVQLDGAKFYYAVRCDYGHTGPNWMVTPGGNTTLNKLKEVSAPIQAYLQASNVAFPGSTEGEKMDIYIHYGGKPSTADYPSMTNEGCLPFHFGIVKTGPVGGSNVCYLKFHGGGGDFYNNSIATHVDQSWKISFDDWIPATGIDPGGTNTRWLGYVESLNIYKADGQSLPPVSGVVRGYTLARVNWELDWILSKWNTPGGLTIDTNRMYLVGASQGCAAVLLLSMITPWKFAAGNMTVPKYDLTAPEDANPDCKFNEGGSAVKQTRIFFGDENITNLYTDIPILPGGNNYFRIYDLANSNYTLQLRKNISLPFLSAVNGKNDDYTCWQEKIAFYNSVQTTNAGGIWEWDLRKHNGTEGILWGSFNLASMKRFSIHVSYPAFSNTSLDNNPGDATVTSPPYYDGDDVGSLQGSVDWVDSSLVDSSYLWQIQIHTLQNILEDGSRIPAVLPESAVTDITVRRAQQFRNFPAGTSLCWMNFYHGKLIQSGTVLQQYEDTVPVPVTIKKVKVYPDGNLFRIMRCDSIQPTGLLPGLRDEHHENSFHYSGDQNDFHRFTGSDNSWHLYNAAGKEVNCQLIFATDESELLAPGIYVLKVISKGEPRYYKFIKT